MKSIRSFCFCFWQVKQQQVKKVTVEPLQEKKSGNIFRVWTWKSEIHLCDWNTQFNFIFQSVYALTCSKFFFLLQWRHLVITFSCRQTQKSQSATMTANQTERATNSHSTFHIQIQCDVFLLPIIIKKNISKTRNIFRFDQSKTWQDFQVFEELFSLIYLFNSAKWLIRYINGIFRWMKESESRIE